MLTDMAAVGSAGTLDQLDSTLLLGVPRFGLSRSSAVLKRSFDLVGASLGIFCAAPLFALIALAVKLDSDGPILFCQKRIGRDGVPFTMYKFRSMVANAEQMKADLDLEYRAIKRLNDGIQLCRDKGDNGTEDLLTRILVSEEEHADWLETQLKLIEHLGEANYLAEQLRDG